MPSIFEEVLAGLGRVPKAIADAWNADTAAVGTPAEAAAAVAQIRAVTVGGYTLYVFTASDAAWSVPAPLADAIEAWAGVIGGGGRGFTGPTEENIDYYVQPGGAGGVHGGYIVSPFDPTTLGATLAIVVGAAAASVGTNGGTSSITNGGTTLAESVPGVDGISTPQGDLRSSAAPGNGGDGGSATVGVGTGTNSARAGDAGQSTTAAAGGTGGAGSTSGTGGTGGNGSAGRTDALPVRGGSGGGGGGGASRLNNSAVGGNGGNGGYPGGGSGGGGAAVSNGTIYNQTGGTPGTAANGLAWILCR